MSAGLVLVVHPSPDLYGSDLQLLVTVEALLEATHEVLVLVPERGPLVARLEGRGARVEIMPFPVLRKSALTPRGLWQLCFGVAVGGVRGARIIRSSAAVTVWVNTLTLPSWLLAAQLARTPVLCHVHEAEEDHPWLVRALLAGQLLLADSVVVNSAAAGRALTDVLPLLRGRTSVVHNGVPAPPAPLAPLRRRRPTDPLRTVLVGRLSPRKGTDVALEAVAELRREGRAVSLELCGTVFPGYEWFERELRDRASAPDLEGAVTFSGYVSPTWPALEAADLVLVPSRVEPFGNTAVEAMHAGRPLIASGTQGLKEVVRSGRTGVLVPPDDPAALAEAMRSLFDDPDRAAEMARTGRQEAAERFTPGRYRASVRDSLAALLGRSGKLTR